MTYPVTWAPALAVVGLTSVAVGDLLFVVTRHDIPSNCSDLSAYTPLAQWAVVLGAALCLAGFTRAIIGTEPLGSERRSWRWMTVVTSGLTLVVGALSLLGMWGASTFQICF